MAILTPSQLQAASNATYFDNTSGSITPTSVRTLNDNWISSSILVNQTGSMSVASASVAGTASFALNFNPSATASYALQALNATNAANASTADTATFASNANTANSANTALSANTATSASFASTASFALNFNPAATASYALFAVTASYALNVPTASVSSSYALTASVAQQISTSISSQNMQHNVLFVDTTGPGFVQVDGGLRYNPNTNLLTTTASLASLAETATTAVNATSASYASNAELLDNLNFTAFVLTSSFVPFSSSVSNRFDAAPTLTGNNTFTGTNNFNIVSASYIQALSASIDYLSVIYQTSSVVYSSGSNIFGDAAIDTQTLWGTVDVVTGPLLVSGSTEISGAVFINNNVLQVTGPGVAPGVNYAGNTLTQLVGTEAAAFDIFLTNGGDSIHVETISGSGTVFQDINGQTFSNETWLTIPSNLAGNNPAPQFNRGLQITGSLNVSGSTILRPRYVGTEQPFTINQVADATAAGGNIISNRNTGATSTGSFTVSGSNNILLLGAGPANSGVLGGTVFGFNGRANIVSNPNINVSGSNTSRVLPTSNNTTLGSIVSVVDNRPGETTTPLTLTNANVSATTTITTSTGSITLANSIINGGTSVTITGSVGTTKTINNALFNGASSLLTIDSPTATAVATGLLVNGNSNTLLSSGSSYNFTATSILGAGLTVTGSGTQGGNAFVGRFNAIDSSANLANTVFGIGTGVSGNRRTSFFVSSSGLTTVRNGIEITGSVNGFVTSASIASNTASLDFSQGNFYTSLVSGSTNFNITNPEPGQTVSLLLTTVGVASASFSSNVKQVSGSAYTPTSGSGKNDVLTFISFDGSSVYLANVKNLI
jgi:hypothetical protein